MSLPAGWNRSRVTAAGLTLLLHLVLAAWLLSLQFRGMRVTVPEGEPIWLPLPLPVPPAEPALEVPVELAPRSIGPTAITPPPELVPEREWAPPDWYATGRAVAREMAGGPERRTFGEHPEEPDIESKKDEHSVFEKPLPRVGTTVTTPEGETIIWVSDRCFVTVGTTSLTLGEFHRARQGVRRCIVAEFGGEKKARGDLFEPIKPLPKKLPEPQQKPDQQEPGCGSGEDPQFCTP